MKARQAPARARASRRGAAVLLALAVAGPAVGPASPGGAATTTAVARAAGRPDTQAPPPVTPTPSAGAYDPGFVDEPLPTNPPSPSLEGLAAESDELDDVRGALDDAEDDRDDAIDLRDDLRRRIVELGEQRVDSVEALAQRQVEERQRGEERAVAVDLHAQRIEEAEVALTRLEAARDDLRELVVAAYVNESAATTDAFEVMASGAELTDAQLRLAYGEDATDARLGDLRARTRDREEAVAAEAQAAADRATAEQAERDAVAARQAAEQAIVDVDAETVATQEDEVDSVAALADREVDVLEATADIAPALLRADTVGDGLDFPVVALDAWLKAAASAPCRVEWWMLAGISKVEGRHGTFGGGRLGARGYPSVKIIGPQLNGAGPFAAIGDTDGGLYDGDVVWDRAVGPMQFIPSTWAAWGRDGDGDGLNDPFTIYDAATGAAAYLCAGRVDLTDEAQLRAAYLSYNQSAVYVETVLRSARGYQAALVIPPHEAMSETAPP